MEEIRIVPTGEEYVEGFHAAVDVVARERRHIALVEAPPLEASRAFVRGVQEAGGVHLVAIAPGGGVVGWCDVYRSPREGFRHVGSLGMGLLPGYRGRGLGRRLMEAAIARAWEAGLERIELEVFASNSPARALYEKLGFVTEGVKRRSRKLDGRYDDNVFMALLRE
jgi:RimJ/RimL family protein N-acetyltransferase